MGGLTRVLRVLKEMSARANTTKASIEAFPSSNGTGTAQAMAQNPYSQRGAHRLFGRLRERCRSATKSLSDANARKIVKSPSENVFIIYVHDISEKKSALETLPGGMPVFVCADLSRLKSATFALTKFMAEEVPSKFAQEMSTMTYNNARAFGAVVYGYFLLGFLFARIMTLSVYDGSKQMSDPFT
ncbi:hypothetical protein DFH09DRAFT_1313216 [Mycena vulgaris]|nr:hypothetical protein DFH09DRAFT_1313216 [Mycena vulgaris]